MNAQTTPALAPRRAWRLWPGPRGITALLLLWLISRWIVASFYQLVPDETYYWTWSRHLALSYLDHPPMIAYLIRLGTTIFGPTELGVRWPAGVMTAGTVLILALITRRLVDHPQAAAFVPVALLFSPMIAVIGAIATPDTPACFFQSAALACVLLIFAPSKRGQGNPSQGNPNDETRMANQIRMTNDRMTKQQAAVVSSFSHSGFGFDSPFWFRHSGFPRGPLWLAFGVLLGLSLDSKYTSVLLGLAVLLALLSCNEGRRHLLTPWPWLGAAVAGVFFSPVIWWNAHHQWASFRFQLGHGLNAGSSSAWKNLGDYAAGQFAVCTPVLFLLCIAVLIVYWRRRQNPMFIRILLLAATTPLVFFACTALHKRPEGNWPMFAYLPGFILIAHYLAEDFQPPRRFWAELAVIVALCGTILLHGPELAWKISGGRLTTPQWQAMFGWRELARDVNSVRFDPLGHPLPVITADYEYASELEFYLPGQPQVWPLVDHTRLTAFDSLPNNPLWPANLPPATWRRVVLVRKLPWKFQATPAWQPLGPPFRYPFQDELTTLQYARRRSLIEIAIR